MDAFWYKYSIFNILLCNNKICLYCKLLIILIVLYTSYHSSQNVLWFYLSSQLSSEFIKHYEKYKNRVGVDKDVYDKEYKELLVFREKYKIEKHATQKPWWIRVEGGKQFQNRPARKHNWIEYQVLN